MIFGSCTFPADFVAADASGRCGVLSLARAFDAIASRILAGAWRGLDYLGMVLGKLFSTARRCRADGRGNTCGSYDDFGFGRNASRNVSSLATVIGRNALAAVATAAVVAIAMDSPASARSPETDARLRD